MCRELTSLLNGIMKYNYIDNGESTVIDYSQDFMMAT